MLQSRYYTMQHSPFYNYEMLHIIIMYVAITIKISLSTLTMKLTCNKYSFSLGSDKL